MKILIIGAGMYVSGRSKTGPGTLLSSLAQVSKKGFITNVTIVATKASNADEIDKAVKRINDVIGSNLVVDYQIIGKNVSEAVDLLCRLQKFDCAIVCVPDHLHFEYGKALISHKVPCLIVKPLVPTLREGVELENLASSLKVYAAVEFHKRWDITNLWIKKALQEKKLGKIL
jgi:predicted dehydrogenase